MLRFLRIRRLAVIDAVEVEFEPGLNVLTGETGAGKSILVEAVGLLLGGRASADLVRTGEDHASVDAIFDHDGGELLVRREVTAQGRSRAFVNGELTTVARLQELSSRLIEIHGQHEHQTLLDPANHLSVLDTFGAIDRLLDPVRAAFDAYRKDLTALEQARQALAQRADRQDFLVFQLAELDKAGLRDGEDQELAAAKQVLASADRVERLCEEAYAALYDRDQAVLPLLSGVWRRVAELAAIDPQFAPYLDARSGITAQLDDLSRFLRRYADGVDASPARLQQVEDRLAVLERIKRKYGPTLADALTKRDAVRAELTALEQGDERVQDLQRQVASSRSRYCAASAALSMARRKAAPELASHVERALAELAMDRTRFEVRFAEIVDEAQWGSAGTDRAEFYLSPNPGEDLRPLARIVSGGELSRIMLAIKTLTSTSRRGFTDEAERPPGVEAPGLIFDEVDAGIGGRTADVVGQKLRALGSASQVLCITHLPQIAAAADAHFLIAKEVDKGRTKTAVVRLDEAARVEEIGRMLGGAGVTEAIRTSAREMLRTRGGQAKGEMKPKGESESRRRRPGR